MTTKIVTFDAVHGIWNNENLVYADDNNPAQYFIIFGGWQATGLLTCSIDSDQFNPGDIITGIKVTIKKVTSDADYKTLDLTCDFTLSGTSISSNYADTANYWDYDGGGYKYRVYGGSADMWGMSLTGADLNTGNYDFRFAAQKMFGVGTIVYVDWIQIEITYTEGIVTTDTYGPAIQVV